MSMYQHVTRVLHRNCAQGCLFSRELCVVVLTSTPGQDVIMTPDTCVKTMRRENTSVRHLSGAHRTDDPSSDFPRKHGAAGRWLSRSEFQVEPLLGQPWAHAFCSGSETSGFDLIAVQVCDIFSNLAFHATGFAFILLA